MNSNNYLESKVTKILEDEDKYISDIRNNSRTLRNIPPQVRTYKICLEVVKTDGKYLKDVPENLKTEEICIEAIKRKQYALEYIPKELKNNEFYNKVLEIEPLAIEFIPREYISKDLISKVIPKNGLAIKYIEERLRTKELCEIALSNNPMALQFIPDKLKSDKLCEELLGKDIRTFTFIPNRMKNKNRCLRILSKISTDENNKGLKQSEIDEIVNSFPNKMHKEKLIIKLEREVNSRRFIKKEYDKGSMKFITIERKSYNETDEVREFNKFIEFYNYLDGNLNNANLYNYDFKGINLQDFNIEGAYINSEILVNQNIYDNEYYFDNIEKDKKEILKYDNEEEMDLVKPESILHELENTESFNNDCKRIYYISDIHLYHKILKKFPEYATKFEIRKYIEELIDNMLNTVRNIRWNDYLLIGGDISTNFKFSKIFYSLLRKKWGRNLIVILGNHELWNIENQLESVDEIFERYKELFDRLDIEFLQNDLLFETGRSFMAERTKINEKDIINYSDEELINICKQSRLIILGGLGFSGLNQKYNASIGLYRNTIKNIEDDKKETDKFTKLYERVSKVLNNYKVIVLTHNPKDDWTYQEYNSNWIYINGHTHRNEYFCNNEKTVYADNQIGYYNTSIGLKFFELEDRFDYFKDYLDGIYTITREQYILFNRGINVGHMQFNVIDGCIYMLKRNNIYCYIYENRSGKLYLLNGGKRLNLEVQDINHYYNRMYYFSEIMNSAVKEYNNFLKCISNEVKSFGGNGVIHGCIIDIDFLNHLYVNPFDGTITPYYALSIVDKWYFDDIKSLLLDNRKDLYDNYINLLEEKDSNIKLLSGKENYFKELIISRYMSETFMYSTSNKMKTIQYLTEMNVIRFWNEDIINKYINENYKSSEQQINNIQNDNLLKLNQ